MKMSKFMNIFMSSKFMQKCSMLYGFLFKTSTKRYFLFLSTQKEMHQSKKAERKNHIQARYHKDTPKLPTLTLPFRHAADTNWRGQIRYLKSCRLYIEQEAMHYGLKLTIFKILNFPLESPSQIAPKVYFFVEQCRTEIQTQVEVGYAWEGFHVIICLQ